MTDGKIKHVARLFTDHVAKANTILSIAAAYSHAAAC